MLKLVGVSVALLLGAGIATQLLAAPNDLGSRWPNAVDVSSSPNWHVYVFHKSGVEYIQINDLSGGVREVVATAGGQFLVLPMGADALRVSVQQQSAGMTASSCETPTCSNAKPMASILGVQPGQLVYQDAAIAVTVATDTSGNLLWNNKAITADTCQPPSCVGQQQPGPH